VVATGNRAPVADRQGVLWRRAAPLLLAALTFVAARPLAAQSAADTTLPAGAEYQIQGGFGGFKRWLYGQRYRALWAAPVAAPSLGLPGPLTEQQIEDATQGRRAGFLHFTAPDGTHWVYRALDRDLLTVAPEPLRENLLPSVIQGLNASRHPGAAPVVTGLATATGARVPPARMVRLDDSLPVPGGDGRLGYFWAADTAGLTTSQLLDTLRQSGARDFDARAYLRERLFDTYLGSWDDAPDLWRWRQAGSPARWTPMPRERDRAFAMYDGMLTGMARRYVPGFVSFGDKYDGQLGMMPLQRALDRQLLTVLDWSVWDSMATAMQGALTDSVITAAVALQAPEYAALNGDQLAATLRARRDALPEAARRLYRLVNQEAALFGTSGPDTVVVTQLPDDGADVEFQDGRTRHFAPGDADAIALYLGGGADLVKLRGRGSGGPWVDIAWQPGLTLRGDRGTGVKTTLFGGGDLPDGVRADVVKDSLPPPEISDVNLLRPQAIPLHGTALGPVVWLDLNSDLGLLLGGGVNITTYRTGHQPYYRWLQVKGGYATTPGDVAVEIHGKFNRWRSRTAVTLDAGLSQIAVLHFFGYGNTTPYDQPKSYYRARQTLLYLYPAWNFRSGRTSRFTIGPVFKWAVTDTTENTLINDTRPYGVPDFSQLGVQGVGLLDTRDAPSFTRHGLLVSLGGAYYPVTFGAGSSFGGIRLSAATYLTPHTVSRVTLALRGTLRVAVGDVPVHEASYAGGSNTLRGYESGRFAGNVAAFFNNEVRVAIGTLPFVVPWRFGLAGIVDVGRVFDPPSADVWHGSFGAGLWLAMPDRSVGGVVTAVHSPEGTSVWFGTAFMF